MKILIVEDNSDQALITRRILAKVFKEAQIDSAPDAREGMSRISVQEYDLVICDNNLPGQTGVEFLKQVKSMSRFENLPFVMVTGSGSERIAVEAMKAGAYDYVTKDGAFDQLLPRVIERTLERCRERKERRRLEAEQRESQEELRRAYAELKAAQQELVQSEKLAALGRFSSGLAHEVKNPLGIILGGLDFMEIQLRKKGHNGEMKDAVDKMKQAVDRAHAIIDGLLRFARPSELRVEKLSVEAMVTEALDLLKYRAPLQNIEIEILFPHGNEDSLQVHADKNQLQQVLFNLFINSVEAMPQGGKLKIKAYKREGSCVVEVADTGVGISAEHLPKLFEPFFTTKRDQKRIGLGLAISKQIIESSHGSLLIESQEGKGSCFSMALSLAE